MNYIYVDIFFIAGIVLGVWYIFFYSPNTEKSSTIVPGGAVVDCKLFSNRSSCNCSAKENRDLPWCQTADVLYDTPGCEGKCDEANGSSACSVHPVSDEKLKLYYCARLK
jgi:hypothetical protein